ncbi:Bromodomain adjacent to zinc finger domain protein 2A [Auxenochlorella protothecoides]|uniref:Bromodomain adjacent to zinc finger domain protein 2A n=1 Tax=Auxenochlorella protothecoides TaxID=3075 RepID=A0A087SF40_AUXPR|nr:Bromodomain adjacent to zinc finger domain protein 2A [Auxenochlorella protothecoides]KFM24344.1 Bromodomain adjacent to zinc finger domain protein 2A [Auxenochlorella protothecoides]
MSISYGRLLIVGREGAPEVEFPLDKKLVLIGRDQSCDIWIRNRTISRKHAEVFVDDAGAVFINSLGQDPVCLNSQPVTSPQELFSGDRIEVRLDDRTRTFFFQGDEETIKVQAPTRALQQANRAVPQAARASPKPASARKRTRASLGPSGKEDVAPASPGRGPGPAKRRGLRKAAGSAQADVQAASDAGPPALLPETAPGAEPAVPAQGTRDAGLKSPRQPGAASSPLMTLKTGRKTPKSTVRRKSVRFQAEAGGTPEGAPADVTITLHLRRGGLVRAVDVDGALDTLAFSEWGLGSMPAEGRGAGAGRSVVEAGAAGGDGSEEGLPAFEDGQPEAGEGRVPPGALTAAGNQPGEALLALTFPASASSGNNETGTVADPASVLSPSDPIWTSGAPSQTPATQLRRLLPGTLPTPGSRFSFGTPTPLRAASGSPLTAGDATPGRSSVVQPAAATPARSSVVQPAAATPARSSVVQPAAATPAAVMPGGLQAPAPTPATGRAPGTAARSGGRLDAAAVAEALAGVIGSGDVTVHMPASLLTPRTGVQGQAYALTITPLPATVTSHAAQPSTARARSRLSLGVAQRALDVTEEVMSVQQMGEGQGSPPATVAATAASTPKGESSAATSEAAAQPSPLLAPLVRALEWQLRQAEGATRAANARAERFRKTARALESALLRERSRRLQLEAVVRAALAAEVGAATAGDEDEAMDEVVADEGSEPGVAEAQEVDPPAAQQQRVVVVGSTAVPEPSHTVLAGAVRVVRTSPPLGVPSATTPTVRTLPGAARVCRPATGPADAPPAPPSTVVVLRPTQGAPPASAGPSTVWRRGASSARRSLAGVAVPEWLHGEEDALFYASLSSRLAELGGDVSGAEEPAGGAGVPAEVDDEVAAVQAEATVATMEEATVAVGEATSAAPAPPRESAEQGPDPAANSGSEAGEFCAVCGSSQEGDVLLLCDACDAACHLACARPRLQAVPSGDWFCGECSAAEVAEEEAKGARSTPARARRREEAKPAGRRGRGEAEPTVRSAVAKAASRRSTRSEAGKDEADTAQKRRTRRG